MVELAISLLLALLPLLGVLAILLSGWIETVDGLFMSLILLAMSGIFLLNVGLEFWRRRAPGREAGSKGRAAPVAMAHTAAGDTRTQTAVVEAVSFYEAPVGQPDKSLVTLRANGSGPGQMIVFQGDLRSVLPVGQRLTITYTGSPEGSRLVAVEK